MFESEFLSANFVLAILLVVIGLVFSGIIPRFYRKNDGKKSEILLLPSGNLGWPILGETIEFLKPHKSNSMGSFLQQQSQRFGRVFKSHIFGSPAIVSCDLELNMFILQNEEKLFQQCYPKSMHGILGKYSLILVSGDLHKKLRYIAISFINSSKSQPKFLLCVEKLAISLMKSWDGLGEIAFVKEAKTFTLSLMMDILLSIGPGEPRAKHILEDFEKYMLGFISLPIYVPGCAYHNAVKARERLSSTVKEMMKERREKHRKNNYIDEQHENVDFLDVVIAKENLIEDERVSIVLDVLLGGYETTATLTSLIVYFLANSPNVIKKLMEEQKEIRENKEDGEALSWEDYKKMDFTYSVICEGLRCGNVVKFVHRKALQDVNFNGIFIPSGWKVVPIFTGAHLDPFVHENPHEFNPWRWTSEKDVRKKMMPFGGGVKLCPGAELAKVVIAFFLHHLVLNYRWKTKADEVPMAYPFVEFRRGLVLEIEKLRNDNNSKNNITARTQ